MTWRRIVGYILPVLFVLLAAMLALAAHGCGSEPYTTSSLNPVLEIETSQTWVPPTYDDYGNIVGPNGRERGPILSLFSNGRAGLSAIEFSYHCPKVPTAFNPIWTRYDGRLNCLGRWFPEPAPGSSIPVTGELSFMIEGGEHVSAAWFVAVSDTVQGVPTMRCTTYVEISPPCNPTIKDTTWVPYILVKE